MYFELLLILFGTIVLSCGKFNHLTYVTVLMVGNPRFLFVISMSKILCLYCLYMLSMLDFLVSVVASYI